MSFIDLFLKDEYQQESLFNLKVFWKLKEAVWFWDCPQGGHLRRSVVYNSDKSFFFTLRKQHVIALCMATWAHTSRYIKEECQLQTQCSCATIFNSRAQTPKILTFCKSCESQWQLEVRISWMKGRMWPQPLLDARKSTDNLCSPNNRSSFIRCLYSLCHKLIKLLHKLFMLKLALQVTIRTIAYWEFFTEVLHCTGRLLSSWKYGFQQS